MLSMADNRMPNCAHGTSKHSAGCPARAHARRECILAATTPDTNAPSNMQEMMGFFIEQSAD